MSAPERPRAGTAPGGRRLPTTLAVLLWLGVGFFSSFFGGFDFFFPLYFPANQRWLLHVLAWAPYHLHLQKRPGPWYPPHHSKAMLSPGHTGMGTLPPAHVVAQASPRLVQGSFPALPLHAQCTSHCNTQARARVGAHVASPVNVCCVCTCVACACTTP